MFNQCIYFFSSILWHEKKLWPCFEPLWYCVSRQWVMSFCSSFFTPPRNRGGVIFSLQFVCVCVCVCLYVCVQLCLWTKFQPNGCTDLDAVFAKRLLSTLAQTLLKLVTLGQRSRSQWLNIHFFFIILC